MVIVEAPARLVTVAGTVDEAGIAELDAHLSKVVSDGIAVLTLDLSRVNACAVGLFAVLTRIHAEMLAKPGWMRLVGLSPAVLRAMENAPIPQILTIYLTSEWSLSSWADECIPTHLDNGKAGADSPRHAKAPPQSESGS